MNIFIISPVRDADGKTRERLLSHVNLLEADGHTVHLPHRDTDQNNSGLNICIENRHGIENADEVHIFYSGVSQGVHFDMGVAFALKKKIIVIENQKYGEGKSFQRMIDEWQNDKGFSA